MSVSRVGVWLAAIAITVGASIPRLRAQDAKPDAKEEILQLRARTKVEPDYPPLARKLHISGTVKVRVVVAPNGNVKEAKVVGGHPVLADAALDAAKKWRFEPTAVETTGILEFSFEPHR